MMAANDRTDYAGVIFDLDGTLIDSTPAVLRSWVQWAIERGIDPERLRGNHGSPAEAIVRKLVPEHEVPAALARITELEVTDVADVTPLPGAVAALTQLSGCHAAIATSCTRELADARIAAAGLSVPEVVITVDDVTRGKPAPDPFLVAAERLGVDPRDCLVVEDAPLGLQAARAAGCSTLAVTTTTPVDELEADLVVTTLAEVSFGSLPEGRIALEVSP